MRARGGKYGYGRLWRRFGKAHGVFDRIVAALPDKRIVEFGGIEALDAWTREVGAHRSLTELGVKTEQVDEIAASIVCLPSGFRQLTTDDVAAILRESM